MKRLNLGFVLILTLLISMCFVCCDNSADSSDECKHRNIIDSEVSVTCDSEGYKLHTCADCGASYKTNRVAPAGHKLEKNVKAPTCEEIGYTTYTCECGFTYKSDYLVPLGHSYTETVIAPTCSDEGYTKHSCSCGDTYTSNHVIPIAHTYVSTIVEPTCTQNGYTENVCECGDSYISDFVSFTGHAYTDEVFPPTCEEGGYTVYTCDCGDTYTADFVSPTGHTFEQNITPATCTEEGYTEYTCACGQSYFADFTVPTGHSFYQTHRVFATLSSTGYTDYACDCGAEYRGDYIFYTDIVKNAYSGNTEIISKGIDISKYQHSTDENMQLLPLNWENIKNEGVDFAILKAGSSLGADPVFEMNYEAAKAAGVDLGVYFYSYATTVEGIESDAYVLLNYLEGKQFEYPIYLDLEDITQETLDKELLTQICIRFFEILQKKGYYAALYTNNRWLTTILDTQFVLDNFDIWYARYPFALDGYVFSSEEQPVWNTELYGENLGMWQFTSTGVLESIPEYAVDINVSYKDYPAIIKALGLNGYGEIPEIDDTVYLWITANTLNVRSSPDFSADNVIGYLTYGDRVEAIEITDDHVKILYNGTEAYIGTKYISYTEVASEI